jgi:hypothetical protein
VQCAVADILLRLIQFDSKIFSLLSGARGMLTRFPQARDLTILLGSWQRSKSSLLGKRSLAPLMLIYINGPLRVDKKSFCVAEHKFS